MILVILLLTNNVFIIQPPSSVITEKWPEFTSIFFNKFFFDLNFAHLPCCNYTSAAAASNSSVALKMNRSFSLPQRQEGALSVALSFMFNFSLAQFGRDGAVL